MLRFHAQKNGIFEHDKRYSTLLNIVHSLANMLHCINFAMKCTIF